MQDSRNEVRDRLSGACASLNHHMASTRDRIGHGAGHLPLPFPRLSTDGGHDSVKT
jgi:hypothetical protein